MLPQQILSASVLDILFEHRNQAYGAYELRRHYPKRLAIALGTLPVVLASAFFIRPAPEVMRSVAPPAPVKLSTVVLIDPPLVPPAAPPPPATQKAARGTTVPTEIVPDHQVVADDTDNRIVPSGTPDGVDNTLPSESAHTEAPAAVAAPVASGAVSSPTAAPAGVQRQPQFPGGCSCMGSFFTTLPAGAHRAWCRHTSKSAGAFYRR